MSALCLSEVGTVLVYQNVLGCVGAVGSDVLVLLTGLQRQISPSGDLKDEQGIRVIAALHPGRDMELFSRFFWKRKSRAFLQGMLNFH